jgi:hypothetical protein
MKTLELVFDRDHHPDIPVGAVLRIKPMHDLDGRLLGYWLIDDATDEPLDLVLPECVRVTRE